jgi:hypothetical protein
MKKERKYLCVLLFCCFSTLIINGQASIPATGGNATGTGGSVSYTVGQIGYNVISGANGSVNQGVQQPYEISVVTATESAYAFTIECLVYPNPTRGLIKLTINSFDHENLRFRIYDIYGVLLQDKKIESRETEISLESQPPSVYFLKIIQDNLEVKVFKIIKR